MQLSSPYTKRWVIDRVDPETVRTAKSLAARHDVRVAEVLNVALEHLWEWLYDEGNLPDGWKEF